MFVDVHRRQRIRAPVLFLANETIATTAGAGGIKDVQPAFDESRLQMPARSLGAQSDHMRGHRHCGRLVIVYCAEIVMQPIDKAAKPETVLLPDQRDLAGAILE